MQPACKKKSLLPLTKAGIFFFNHFQDPNPAALPGKNTPPPEGLSALFIRLIHFVDHPNFILQKINLFPGLFDLIFDIIDQ